jgi:hypothetical protein
LELEHKQIELKTSKRRSVELDLVAVWIELRRGEPCQHAISSSVPPGHSNSIDFSRGIWDFVDAKNEESATQGKDAIGRRLEG